MEHYDESLSVESLLSAFGLSRLEAGMYCVLLQEGALNGYEMAKKAGISRSNAYTALSSLVDKGAAWLMEGSPTRYTPVSPQEFMDNCLNKTKRARDLLLTLLPTRQQVHGGYITIRSSSHILDRLRHMIQETRERLYLEIDRDLLLSLIDDLAALCGQGKRLVLITQLDTEAQRSCALQLPGAEIHTRERADGMLRAISDSSLVLAGDSPRSDLSTCVFSDERNLVDLVKNALKNELTLAELGQNRSES